ncbi:MAG: hypothetical protein OIF40_03855 [Mangrovicoccus sp.]|nr:hypothetical protein [Mangrovicoccus sp.]
MVLDWRVVIFPVMLLVATTVLASIPGRLVSGLLFGASYSYLFFVTMTSC